MSLTRFRGANRRRLARFGPAFLAAFLVAAIVPLASNGASAAVRSPRLVESFYGRDLVILQNYPASTSVRTDVIRNGQVIGSATYTTDATGLLEINHVGEGDCWQGTVTPDISPGDRVETTILGGPSAGQVDSTVTRDVFIDLDSMVLNDGNGTTGTIRISGHARSLANAPLVPGVDILELRLNKVNTLNPWDSNGRRDLREDVGADIDPSGAWTHTFTVATDDVRDVRQNGVDQSLEWSTDVGTEITVYDGDQGVFPECPPHGTPPPQPAASLSPTSVGFGAQNVGTTSAARTVTLTNSGDGSLSVSGVALNGANANQFSQTNTCVGASLSAGASCSASVRFAPTSAGTKSASLAFTSNAPGSPHSAALSGNGVSGADTTAPVITGPTINPNPFNHGAGRTTRIGYSTNEACTAIVRILNSAGNTVKLFASQACSVGGVTWDGRNNNNNLVPIGTYRARVKATDAAGNASTKTTSFRVT